MIQIPTRLIIQAPGEQPGLINAYWIYDEEDPTAVVLRMPPNEDSDEPNDWCFSRELVNDALRNQGKTMGYHDVKIMVAGPRTIIDLDSGDGSVRILVSTYDVKTFLHQTYRQIPIDQEQKIIDKALDMFLSEVSSG